MGKRKRFPEGGVVSMGRHRSSGRPPGDNREAARLLNRESDVLARARRRRVYASIRELMANRRNRDV